MKEAGITVLVVDDEEINLQFLCSPLEDAGYITVTAENGLEAWNLLKESPEQFNAILLDRVMPELDGMEVLEKIKDDDALKRIPVILQTAMDQKADIEEGLKAGAYYYLTKPYVMTQMLAIVKTATESHLDSLSLQEEARQTTRSLALLDSGSFSFRSLQEGHQLVTLLGGAVPGASNAVMGLSELVINAIEHGNLGITYAEKSKLRGNNTWGDEVARRLTMPEYRDRRVRLDFERDETKAQFLIQDQGEGFDWQDYMEFSADRAFDSHGRGIAMANSLSFDKVEYRGNGNQVLATVLTSDC